ncbi:7-carboxy-7-deazaguanine synthase QueE [Sphingomonas ginsenosidivorax]|uniref:7-carboxy-7-deazaguanine synthase n=1 Tax=Sphingomonas ginsenosidivorax TaxID=862135 RepID=A0A5C6UGZ5_9SPHN|nr:7-carboxy-7-deazaguanine synthase QueE [Sphingomonas ginsenosidivorax]TXC71456.1 7-carboxy-7-deazaguanine synthase QueE [Sphingomonas ginsenosidivorax]
MFGGNPARAQEMGDGASLWIQEVFYTLQGEGPFAGDPAVFVRTAGCNIRCYWCDTDFESSTWRPALADLIAAIETHRPAHCDLIVLTGGEPFRQNIAPLVQQLLARGLRVQIETNGTLSIPLPVDDRLTIVCSPKTKQLHDAIVPRITAYKYVLAAGEVDPDDGLPMASTQKAGQRTRLFRPPSNTRVFVMPRDDGDAVANRAHQATAAGIAMRHGYRLCLQLHKLLDLP